MNSNSKRLGIYLATMLTLTSAATVLRTIACIKHLDYSSGFFNNKSLSGTAEFIIWLTVIGMLSYAFTATRIKLVANFSTGATYVPTGILGVATAFIGMSLMQYATSISIYPLFTVDTLTNPAVLLGIIASLLAFASIGYHFLNAFVTETKSNIRTYFASATIAFLALYAIMIYLDDSLSMNDPAKILRQTAFLLAAIFFLYEERISLGREMWRVYSAFGLAAASLTAYTSIPAIITYYVKGRLISSSGKDSIVSLEEYLLLLAIFIFILARLCLTLTLKEDKENELIRSLSEYANERRAKTVESEERHKALFASKQLSIFDLYGGDFTPEAEEDETIIEDTKTEKEKEIIISDDAIYESIFGKMPERNEEIAEQDKEPEITDDREPEQIVEDILNTVDEALRTELEKKNKES